ncbi:putative unusual protein kinase regulating ubiquinone biosynthesis, AarF/ABC1/UbiB family [Williamsia serinedens]|uniref:Unusual protein kinase regulating ubiquinone biosynthesis, AarF/ABC1/UbiB family n=2 Tax=Williamsia serinedens TaxID=391736 RepID=A0ABT1GXN7_9NOCA|nr:putative unusual protein kinase regulating ubiquinone biosynthesis, AarF/ABC1/UbiB family [Williamsia serinedens]
MTTQTPTTQTHEAMSTADDPRPAISADVDAADGVFHRLPGVSPLAEARRMGVTAFQVARGGVEFAAGIRPGAPLAPRAAREVRDVFERLGPTYVKLGQLIASSPGVFTPLLSREFESLLDRVAPAPAAAVEQVLTDELGAPPSEVFAEFDLTPIASASIAQVHTATLHSGERVVVKVQRPGIAPRLAADVQILTHLARLAEISEYGRMLSARDVVDDFAAGLNAEIDFRNEASAMEDFVAGLAETSLADRVRVPRVHREFTTAAVLTMEYVEAVRIDDVKAVRNAGHDGTELVRTLLLSFLESAFHGGVFHGDLHAGNVLVDAQGRLVLLDFGIVGRFDPRTRRIMRRLVGDLFLRNDYESAGRALFTLGAVKKPGGTRDGAKDMRRFIAPTAGKGLGSMSYTDLGKQLADLARAYDLRLPRELVLVGKQLLYVEKYMKLLAPNWRALTDRELFTFMSAMLTEDDPRR